MKLRFKVLTTGTCNTGKPRYEANQILFEPWGNTSFTVMLGVAYVGLDIASENGTAYHVSGYNPKRLWISQRLHTPDSQKGQLQVISDTPFVQGSATDYHNSWHTFVDLDTSWVCMGNRKVRKNCEVVEFSTNTLAVVKDGELKAIWVKPLFND